jgi:phenylacetate-CoA ligase
MAMTQAPPPGPPPPSRLARLALRAGDVLLGPRFARARRELTAGQWQSPDALQQRQNALVARICRHAASHVPFWRSAFRERGLATDAIRAAADLRLLPVVDRDTLRSRPLTEFLAENVSPDRRVPYTTSGSTGDPLRFVLDRANGPLVLASHLFFDSWFGIEPFDRCLRIAAPPPPRERIPRRALAARLAASLQEAYERRMQRRLSTFEADADAVWDALVRQRPAYVMGYTSTLATAAAELLRRGRTAPHELRCAITIAETLTPERRRAIEDFFGAPIANRYGQREFKYWCAQSEPGDPSRFCAITDLCAFETLRGDGEPCAPGEVGRLVLTHLHNDVMPFLRYDTRDLAALEPSPWPEGRGYPLLTRLVGRSQEVLVTPSGRRVDPVSLGHWLFVLRGHVDGVRHYQLVETDTDAVTLHVVLDEAAASDLTARLRDDLAALLGPGVRIAVDTVPEIPLERSGKRPTIKLLTRPTRDG